MSGTNSTSDNKNVLLKDAVFWVSIATITIGLLKYIISYMLKSKCSDFSLCWGAIKIKRDIQIERDIEIAQIHAGITNNELPEPINISLPGSRRPSAQD
jgi:hypothetical protein